jgi:hypothetical protein
MRPSRIVPALITIVCISAPPPTSAQSVVWTETSTLGYGLLGGALGVGVCLEVCGLNAGIFVAIVTPSVVGFVAGHRIGRGAERAARQGNWPRPTQLWGARVGTVTAFAGLGLLVAAQYINTTDGNGPGDDERLLRNLTLGGAGVGVAVEIIQERAVRSQVGPASLAISRRPTGGLGVGLKIGL